MPHSHPLTYLQTNSYTYRTTYNYYVAEKMKAALEKAKENGEKINTVDVFQKIANDWKNQGNMSKWYE